jgi:predicted GTPase
MTPAQQNSERPITATGLSTQAAQERLLQDGYNELYASTPRRDRRSTPAARGSLIDTFERYPWVGDAAPAMGYSKPQLDQLAATIIATPCDSIVVATPVDLARLLPFLGHYCRVRYDRQEVSHPDLSEVVSDCFRKQPHGTKQS